MKLELKQKAATHFPKAKGHYHLKYNTPYFKMLIASICKYKYKATVKVNVWKSFIYGGSGVFFPVPGLLFLWLQMT